MAITRRDFLKVSLAAFAGLAIPKPVFEIAPVVNDTVLVIPAELELALSNMSMMRLDALGIRVDGLNDIQDEQAWEYEVMRRWKALS